MRYDPRIKPPQWGPTTSVQAAVRDNCRRLGLPLPYILCPFWDNYPYDVMSNTEGTTANLAWNRNAADFTHKQARFDTNRPGVDSYLEYTLSIVMQKAPGSTLSTYTNFHRNGSNEYDLAGAYRRTSTGEIYHRIGLSDDYTFSPSINIMDGGVHVATWSVYSSANDYKKWYVDGILDWHNIQTVASTADNSDIFYSRPDTTDGSSGSLLFLAGSWNETLTDDQVFLLHEQPYALIQPVARTRYFIPDAEPSEPGTGRGQLILISDGLKVMSPAAWAGVCGMSGVIRNPKLTKREMLNPLNWLRK